MSAVKKPSSRPKWSPLEPGDTIDVVAPGFGFPSSDIQKAQEFIESLGFKARIPKDLLGKDLICSNSKEVRLKHLKAAFTSKDSKMVWCLRGGYGSLHLLTDLAKMKKPKQAKLFWGYSDATSIQQFLSQNWGWASVHGPLLDWLSQKGAASKEAKEIKEILLGKKTEQEFKALKPMNLAANNAKKINGTIEGGNLIVLASSLGTAFAPQLKGKILFLEEVAERAYRIDRCFTQLELAGAFKGVKAIVLGDFIGAPDKDNVDRVHSYLKQYAKESKIPIYSGMPMGHGKLKRPIPFHTKASLKGGAKATLICSTGI